MNIRTRVSNQAMIILAGSAIVLFVTVFFGVPFFNSHEFIREEAVAVVTDFEVEVIPEKKVTLHLKTPEPLKSLYMSSCVAATPSLRTKLVNLILETELNAVVIDIKDYTGMISFNPEDPELTSLASDRCRVSDMKEFIEDLHHKGIYVMGRIQVFQDVYLTKLRPDLAVKKMSDQTAVWKDRKGLSFTDPGAREVWDHTVKIALESYNLGFDELNFDYIRFPSDGNMSDIYFPFSNGRKKADVLEGFFAYLNEQLKGTGVVTSADLFGMTTTSRDDLNIGQVLERALPHFDFIAPMVYPSHYPTGFNGWGNPNHVPYEIVKFAMESAVKRTIATSTLIQHNAGIALSTTTPIIYSKEAYSPLKLRTWIQDFNYGGTYGPKEVRTQIQATYDAGLTSWMLWDPSNRYTRDALLSQ